MSSATLPAVIPLRPRSRASSIRWFLRKNPRMLLGLVLLGILLFVAAFAPFIAPYDPIKVNILDQLQPPSFQHWLGTDDLGRDVFSRVLWGSRVSLSVGVISVTIGFLIGVSVGLMAGYLGGTFDLLAMRVIDALLAFPALVLAIAITASLGPQIQNAMIAIGIVAIPGYARLTRGQVLSVRSREFILAARTVGVPPRRIVLRHIFPNIANDRARRAGHARHRVRDPRRGGALVPRSRAPAPVSLVGAGHQLLAALPREHEMVDERRSGERDLHRRVHIQLPRGRAPGCAGSAAAPQRVVPRY